MTSNYLFEHCARGAGEQCIYMCIAGAAQRTIRMFVISKSRSAKSSSALASELQALGFPDNQQTSTFASQLLDRFATKKQPSVCLQQPRKCSLELSFQKTRSGVRKGHNVEVSEAAWSSGRCITAEKAVEMKATQPGSKPRMPLACQIHVIPSCT